MGQADLGVRRCAGESGRGGALNFDQGSHGELVDVSIFLTSEDLSRPVPGNGSRRGTSIWEACGMDSDIEGERGGR